MKPLKGLRILIVDDDLDLARATKRVLTADGAEVVTAHRPRSAEQLIDAAVFDVVLTDYNLQSSEGTGLRVARYADAQELPAVVWTGGLECAPMDDQRELKQRGFLAKPVPYEEIRERLLRARRPPVLA